MAPLAAAGAVTAVIVATAVMGGEDNSWPHTATDCSVPAQTYAPLPVLVAPPSGSTTALSDLVAAVGTLGQSDYADVYTGAAMDAVADKVYVWRVESPPVSADFDRAIRAMPDSGKVEIYCAPYSERQLLAWMDQLLADRPRWESVGLPLHEFGPRVDGICIELGTEDPERAEQELPAAYPEIPFCFYYRSRPDMW
jgi:hypothetical protein